MSDFVRPRKVSPGDTIAIIAPSEPVERKDIEKTQKYLEGLGYKVKLGKNLFKRIGNYAAGTVEERAADLNRVFADKEIAAIFMAVGGYTADQILGSLDFEVVRRNPKVFLGYSDATILQAALLSQVQLVSFHGPSAASLHETTRYTRDSLWNVLGGNTIGKIEPVSDWQVLKSGSGRGILIGGNLDSFCSILGTVYDPLPNLANRDLIFFWEEYECEYDFIIRRLYQIKNTGILSSCRAMVVGKITKCYEKEYKGVPDLTDVLTSITREYNFPILSGVDFGHVRDKITIPIGVEGWLDTAKMEFGFEKAVTD